MSAGPEVENSTYANDCDGSPGCLALTHMNGCYKIHRSRLRTDQGDNVSVPDLVPVEQLVGWTRNPDYDGDGWAWVRPDGIIVDGAEVDDLLEWLRDNDCSVRSDDCYSITSSPVLLDVYQCPIGTFQVTAATLRGALVAAVREATQ